MTYRAVTAKADGLRLDLWPSAAELGTGLSTYQLLLLCISSLALVIRVDLEAKMPRASHESSPEEEPLLPTQNGEVGRKPQSKLSSFLSLFSKQSPPLRGANGVEAGDEEYRLSARRDGTSASGQWRTWTLYVVLLGLGGLLGWFFTSRWDAAHRDGGKEGPMVPPVWTLPPVSAAEVFR